MNEPADKLIGFLEKGGAEILTITNPWELVRFKTARGTHVIYENSKGRKSFSDKHAQNAYHRFSDGKDWIADNPVKRRNQRYLLIAITKRDGESCFFCPRPFTDADPVTIEHLLALSRGGSNNIDNLALAHKSCNNEAGAMCITQKVRMREKNWGEL